MSKQRSYKALEIEGSCENRPGRIGPDTLTGQLLRWPKFGNRLIRNRFRRHEGEVRYGAYIVWPENISIGRDVVIRPGSFIYAEKHSKIVIGDYVLLGPGVHIYTNNHQYNQPYTPIAHQGYKEINDVWLQEGCWIGANSVILAGVIIGRYSVVGAGSVVTKNVPPSQIWAGVPARKIGECTS